jgi:hypothetical protein
MNRYVCLILLITLTVPVTLLAAERPVAVMPEKHAVFIRDNCLQCHNADTQEGKVDLENLSFDLNDLETAEVWQKVLNAMNSGEMPPEDEKQPSAEMKTAFLEDLSEQIVTARKILSDSGGVITMRRLNRREYVNTIRSLLGVEVNAQDLPDDASSGGFDTSGGSLFFSSDQFEQYLKIARRALDDAIVTGERPETVREKREAEVAANRSMRSRSNVLKRKKEQADAWRKSDQPPSDFGFIDAARVKFEESQYDLNFSFFEWYVNQPAAKDGALLATSSLGAFVDTTTIPPDAPPGNYLLRVQVGALDGAQPHRKFLEFGRTIQAQTGELEVLGCQQITGTRANPQIIEISISIGNDGTRSFGLRERQPNNRTAARLVYRSARAKNGIGPIPGLWVDWVEWEGPIVNQWPPLSHKQVFFKKPGTELNEGYAREIIENFAERAFRIKKPSTAFVDKLMLLFQERIEMGEPFHEAIKEPLSVVLASPSFLYLGESSEGQQLTDTELAVRLAYFLWSCPPDNELLEIAKQGKLRKPDVLRQQTDRLLEDARSSHFISGFTHQWLHMERLDFFQFNHRLYPQFDESAKQAARQEVYETISTVLRDDLNVGRLLKSDFVVINDLLAAYYGIDGVTGNHFRKVKVPQNSPRGGLLGTAAILAMGSDGERSSPVERGAWVMRKLLHDPPPPAPPNVPQLSRLNGQLLSARDLQTAHMEEPQCAQCHRKIDPIGFGLQNFDAIGRWRDEEYTEVAAGTRIKKKKLHPIDASGTLPDGTTFTGYFELRDGIAEHEETFARGLTESLIAYGLGRPYGFTDFDLAEEIIDHVQSNRYRLKTFIHSLIQSEKFQSKSL